MYLVSSSTGGFAIMLQYIDRPPVTSENSTPTPTQTLKYRGVTYSPEPDHNLAQPSDVIDWELSQPLIYRGIPYIGVAGSIDPVSVPQETQMLCYRGVPYVSLSSTCDPQYALA
jgi:hypothetical protein